MFRSKENHWYWHSEQINQAIDAFYESYGLNNLTSCYAHLTLWEQTLHQAQAYVSHKSQDCYHNSLHPKTVDHSAFIHAKQAILAQMKDKLAVAKGELSASPKHDNKTAICDLVKTVNRKSKS